MSILNRTLFVCYAQLLEIIGHPSVQTVSYTDKVQRSYVQLYN